jgi:hypothetical protein
MNKSEINLINRESRELKKALATRQKATASTIKKHRKIIRSTQIEITKIERDLNVFELTTNDRLAILEGRLNS